MESDMHIDALPHAPEIKRVPTESVDVTFTETPLGLGYGAIHAPETTQAEAQERARNMTEFFVEVDPNEPSDCIDGRHALKLLDGSPYESPRAGTAGGASVTGYAAAELTRYFGESEMTIKEKFDSIVERLETEAGNAQVIKVGGHVDADAVESDFAGDKTGCGAADKFIANIALLSTVNVTYVDRDGNTYTETDEERDVRINAVKTLTKAVYVQAGYYTDESVDSTISSIMDTATELVQYAKLTGWSGTVMREALEEKGSDRLVVLDTSAGGVHGHTERKVLFNFMDNTTFDQDAYFDATEESEGTGREIFDVDVWHIRDIANKLADSPDEKQPSQLFTAGVAFQIGTYLGLCDGSHRAFFAKTRN